MTADTPVPPPEDATTDPVPAGLPPGLPPGPPQAPQQSWWDRVLTMRGVVAVALASMIFGGFAGTAFTAVVAHVWSEHGRDGRHHHHGWRDGRMGPREMGPGQMDPGNGWRSGRGGSDIPIPSPPAPEGTNR